MVMHLCSFRNVIQMAWGKTLKRRKHICEQSLHVKVEVIEKEDGGMLEAR